MIKPRLHFAQALHSGLHALGLLERRCSLCGQVTESSARNVTQIRGRTPPLCSDCMDLLAPRTGGYCPYCGEMTAAANAPVRPCGNCFPTSRSRKKRKLDRTWDMLHFYAPYSGVLRACILAFKMESRLGLGALLQHLTLTTWQMHGAGGDTPDLVAPVPLHPKRLRMRGFNQSVELARPLQKHAGLLVLPKALARQRPTVPQFTLQRSERAKNIKGAFTADASIVSGKHVLLLDDIMTSGATISECARTLRKSGAARVDVLVLARTPGA